MLRKNLTTIQKMKQFQNVPFTNLQNHFSRTTITILTWQVNVRTLDRESKLRAQYPYGHIGVVRPHVQKRQTQKEGKLN